MADHLTAVEGGEHKTELRAVVGGRTHETGAVVPPDATDDTSAIEADDAHAEASAVPWPTGLDLDGIERQVEALRAATNHETATIYLRGETRRFTERFSFEGLDVQPSGLRERFMAERAAKYDAQRRDEARALLTGINEARRALEAAIAASQRLALEADRPHRDEATRLLARLVDGQEMVRVERQVGEMTTAMVRRTYERTKDHEDRWFVAGVERAMAEGRLRPDDADELRKLQKAIRARQAGRTPRKIREGLSRLDALTGRPTFMTWLKHVARDGAGIAATLVREA